MNVSLRKTLSLAVHLAFVLILSQCSSRSKVSTDAPASPPSTAAEAAKSAAQPSTKASDEESHSNTNVDSVTCKSGGDERTIRIEKAGVNGCDLKYKKFDEEKSVASSLIGLGHCERIRDRIQSKLSDAGFQCGPSK